MKLKSGEIYHVYNRGNNRQRLFYETRNYYYFLEKVKKYIAPHCDLLAYCLMPNHFHFLIHANDNSIAPCLGFSENAVFRETSPLLMMNRFSNGMKMLLSSYAKAINKGHKRSGSLFTQNTKAKRTSNEAFLMDYSLWCFIYIHNNPFVSGLASAPENWAFSSYREYLGKSHDPICNIALGTQLLSLNINELITFNTCEIPEHILDHIF